MTKAKMKKSVLKTSNWWIEFGGFTFAINPVIFFGKPEDKVLRIAFCGASIDHTFPDNKARDAVHKQIKEWLYDYAKASINRSKDMKQHIDTTTSLQKKILKEGCRDK